MHGPTGKPLETALRECGPAIVNCWLVHEQTTDLKQSTCLDHLKEPHNSPICTGEKWESGTYTDQKGLNCYRSFGSSGEALDKSFVIIYLKTTKAYRITSGAIVQIVGAVEISRGTAPQNGTLTACAFKLIKSSLVITLGHLNWRVERLGQVKGHQINRNRALGSNQGSLANYRIFSITQNQLEEQCSLSSLGDKMDFIVGLINGTLLGMSHWENGTDNLVWLAVEVLLRKLLGAQMCTS